MAKSAPCRVVNLTQGTHDSSLKRMVRRSHDGDKLVFGGTCAGQIVIRTDITIVGKGKWPTITGRHKHRVVHVKPGAAAVLKRLTIKHGYTAPTTRSPASGLPNNDGGGIWNAGQLTLRRVTVRDNAAKYRGGGIANSGRLAIINSTIRLNKAGYHGSSFFYAIGSAIYNTGRLSLTGSTVSDNNPRGIVNKRAGRLVLTHTIVSDNGHRDHVNGAGILSWGTASLADSTLSGNEGRYIGGGILIRDGVVNLVRTTVVGNEAYRGAGIYVDADCADSCSAGEVILTDTEVTGNTGDDGAGIYAEQVDASTYGKVTLQGSSSVHDNVPDDCVGTTAC